MTTAYPAALDNFADPVANQPRNAAPTETGLFAGHSDAIEAIEARLGISSAVSPVTGMFNVADYGALGDATTQTTAIQAAITAAGAAADGNHRGGTVWFPRGSYIITATLTIPSFVRLTGPGRPWHTSEITGGDPSGYYGADIAAGGALNFDMFANSDVANGNSGIEIDHLRLDQRGVTGDKDIMRFTLGWRCSIHDNDLLGATGTTNQWGVHFVSGEENRVSDNRFDQCGLNYVGNALTARHNDIGAFGIVGIQLVNGFGSRIHENHIYNTSQDGIYLHNQIGCTFIANHIEDCDWHGIYGKNLIQDCVFTGNVIKQNSRASAGARSGIYIDSDTAASPSIRNILTGNQCIDTQGSPTQQYGIYLGSFSGTQTTGNLVSGNMFFGNTSAGFGQKAGMANIVRDNAGYVTEASGTGTINSGSTTATVTHGLSVTPTLKDITVILGELSTTDPDQIWVGTIGATTFVVNCRTNPGASNLDFGWRARVL